MKFKNYIFIKSTAKVKKSKINNIFSGFLDYWRFFLGERKFLEGVRRVYVNPGMRVMLMYSLINDLGNKGFFCFFLRRIYNSWRVKYGIDIPLSTKIGRRFRIYHFGNIFINPGTVIGNNVSIMQGVTVGNLLTSEASPIIGDRCFLGAGSKVLGSVYLAPDIKVGANAVVVRSCHHSGATLVGVPAKQLRYK